MTAARPRVFVARIIPEDGLAPIRESCDATIWEDDLPPPRDDLLDAVRGCDGVLTLLTDRVDDEFLDAAGPGLKVVSNYAVGFDNIDVPACTRRGIPAGNTPGVLTETTADLAFALLMAAARRLPEGDRYVRDGRWKTWGPLPPPRPGRPRGDDRDRRVRPHRPGDGPPGGVASAWRCCTRTSSAWTAPVEAELGATFLPLEELLPRADFVSLHTNLTPETKGMIDAEKLSWMKPNAVLVNTSRGPVVDHAAPGGRPAVGRIFAAALDVTDPEPMPVDDPLVGLDNCLVVPHIASGVAGDARARWPRWPPRTSSPGCAASACRRRSIPRSTTGADTPPTRSGTGRAPHVERPAPAQAADGDQHAERGEDEDRRGRDRRVEVAALELAVDDERQRLRPALDVAGEHDRRAELAEGPRPGHHDAGGEGRRRPAAP